MLFAKGDDFLCGGGLTGFEHHGGVDRLSPALVRYAENSGFQYLGMHIQHVFNFG